MPCLLCGMADEASACSFHPGRPFLSHSLGPRGDWNDAYIWSCCGRYAESSVDVNGYNTQPPHSPGCVIQQQHISIAAIHLFSSEKGRDLALKTAAALKDSGFRAEISDIRKPSTSEIEKADCVVFVSADADAPLVENWVEQLSVETGPWVLVCYLTRGNERSRIQQAEANDLVSAAIQGVRQRFAQRSIPEFKIFLSYRHADSAIAAAVHRFAAQCWWDKAMFNPGVDWASELVMAIEGCQLFVLVVRDPLPSESYVWRELNLALKHHKPIAILSFGAGGEDVLSQYGSLVEEMKPAGIWANRPIANAPRDRILFLCHPSTPPKLLYFSNLCNQLRVSLPSDRAAETRETYDTENAVKLFNFLGNYPESSHPIRFL